MSNISVFSAKGALCDIISLFSEESLISTPAATFDIQLNPVQFSSGWYV